MMMLVFLCDFAGACRTEWVEMKDHEVTRAKFVMVPSLQHCKTKCLAIPTCYGVNYSPGLKAVFWPGLPVAYCSLAGPRSGKLQRLRKSGTPWRFYKLVKCPTPGGEMLFIIVVIDRRNKR